MTRIFYIEFMWHSVYIKQDDIVFREIAGEFILVPIRGKLADMQRIFTLESVGEHIWQELDGKKTLTDILNSVLDQFDVVKATAESDIADFIHELLDAKLIVEVR